MNERRLKKSAGNIRLKESISCLPEEIQAFILSKLDGNTAAKAKRVCKLWNELLTELETGLHFWLRCCLKEIPSATLVELTKLTLLSGGRDTTLCELAKDWADSLSSKLPWMFWREVYAEYYRCSYIVGGIEKKIDLYYFPLYGEVGCLHLQDGVIYSGHRNGNIMGWQNVEDGVTCDLIYKHDRRVTSISGLDMGMGLDIGESLDMTEDNTVTVLRIRRVTSTSALLYGESSNIIVSSSRDTTLKVHNIDTEETKTLRVYSKHVNCVRSWGRYFVAAASGSMLQGQPLWCVSAGDDLSVDMVQQLFSQSAADITAVAFWDNNVISGDEMGNLFHWNGSLEPCRKSSFEDMCPIANLSSPVKYLYLHGSRIVCFTADGFLHVSEDFEERHFVSYDIYDAAKKSPECISIRASILAVGFQSGFVFLYHLPTVKSWRSLNLSQPSRIVSTHQEHINAVAIGDDGAGPCVVIATEGSFLTVIQFRRQTEKEEMSNVPVDTLDGGE